MQHARTLLDRMVSQALLPLINIGVSGAVAALLLDLVAGLRPARVPVQAERER